MPITIAGSGIVAANIADANITAAKLDGAQSGSAPIYGARAWVNFNGTGTVVIRASGNVSSITDNGTGDYTVNFTTAMVDANYAINVCSKRGTLNESLCGSQSSTAPTAGSCRIIVGQGAFTLLDGEYVNVSVFR